MGFNDNHNLITSVIAQPLLKKNSKTKLYSYTNRFHSVINKCVTGLKTKWSSIKGTRFTSANRIIKPTYQMFNLCHFLGLKSFQLLNILLILDNFLFIFWKEWKFIQLWINHRTDAKILGKLLRQKHTRETYNVKNAEVWVCYTLAFNMILLPVSKRRLQNATGKTMD